METKKTRPDKEEASRRILASAAAVLESVGLTDWTVEKIASHAGCAKGLVLYHFGSKTALLQTVARDVRDRISSRRISALRGSPAQAIDRLWEALADEVTTGAYRLWLSLVADRETTGSASIGAPQRQYLAITATKTFKLDPADPALFALPAILDGFQLLLLQGVPEVEVREAFDSYWLELLGRAG